MQLIRLYRADDDDTSGRKARQQLRSEYPTHLGCIAFLAREALRDHDLSACEDLLPTLRRLGPGQFDAVAIEFQFRALAGAGDLGRQVLDDYIASAPSPEARAERAVRSADLVFDFFQTHPADERSAAAVADLRAMAIRLYRPEAARNPQAFQRLVTLLASQPDGTNQAFTLIERSKRTFSGEVASAAYVMVLRYGRPSTPQQQAMKRYLVEQREKAPRSMSLLLTWAEYLQLTGETATAVAVYREILRREPDNVLALNNLAWTLSLDRKDPDKVRESITLIQHAIDLAGPQDELLDTRARILFESGQSEAGLRDMCEAVNAAPSAGRLKDYAIMLRKAGKTKEAERALAEAGRFAIGASR
jgi:tetratricopeptide (TPR) repeat protein